MRYQKVFIIAIALTGILLVVFLGQLAKANTTWGAGVGQTQARGTATGISLSQIPTIVQPTPTLAVSTSVPRRKEADPTDIPLPPTQPPIASPTLAIAQTAANQMVYHTVQAGETLIQIAEVYGSSVEEIITRNRLPSSGAINNGQLLLIPVFRATAAPESLGITVNGLPLDAFIIMPADVQENVRAIYARGLSQGRDPYSFSVIGDSTVETLYFLTGFETQHPVLGEFAFLEPVLAHYAGSFARPRMAVLKGIHSRQVFLDTYANPEYCAPTESMIDCEWRLHNPSVVLIRIGSNDGKPELFDSEVRRMVTYALEMGTVPVIGTKADQYLDPGYVNNELLRQIAKDYRLPLWDFQLVAQTLPDNGLLSDQVHLTLFNEFDWTISAGFRTGHGLQNLTALLALDAILSAVTDPSIR